MQDEINIEDLDRTHRIGKVNNGKSRPIIVKFARYNVRKKVFHNKRKLKGKNMSITESLTKKPDVSANGMKHVISITATMSGPMTDASW